VVKAHTRGRSEECMSPLHTSTNPTALFFIVARQTNASLTAELEQLRPVKEQLDSLWIVLAVVFTLGVLF